MPRTPINIERFDRGFTDKISIRDLREGSLAEATNVDVSAVGKVTNSGSFGSSSGVTANDNLKLSDTEISSFQAGHNLFSFKSDVAPLSGKVAGTHIVYTDGDGEVFINDSAGSPADKLISFDSADVTTTSTGCKAVYYYGDGGLRITNSVLTDTNAKQLALIRQSRDVSEAPMYSGSDTEDVMHLFSNGLTAPAVGQFTAYTVNHSSGVPTDTDGAAVANDIGIGLLAAGDDGLWQAGDYAVGLSYVYHNNQESLLTTWSSNLTITEGQYPIVQISIDDDSLDVSTDELFIQGLRVYLRNLTSGDEEFQLLIDVDFEQGSRISMVDEFDSFEVKSGYVITNDAKNDSTDTLPYAVKQPNIETFATINGYMPDEKSISFSNNDFGYKTATVANQRAFVANVSYVDGVGTTKIMGDRIQYSPVLRYDTFPQSYFIDIGANDGDEIVKLIEFRDRLFVYKKNKLFIINISSTTEAGWYLEGEFLSRGVESPNAVVKTDLGIMWANQHGLFAFSNGIQKLSESIEESTWSANMSFEDIQVGFLPKKNQIVVIKNSNSTSSVGYIYDLLTKSFVNLNTSSVLKNKKISNLLVVNNELVTLVFQENTGVTNEHQVLEFNINTPVAQTLDIQTKEYTGGLNSVDKRFYSVYLTYKNNDTNLYLRARYDDDSSFTNKFHTADSSITSDQTSNRLNSATLTTQEFKIASVLNKKSIQLQIAGVSHAEFELQDVTIIARPKGVR